MTERTFCDRCPAMRGDEQGWNQVMVHHVTEDLEDHFKLDLCPKCVSEFLAWIGPVAPYASTNHVDGEEALPSRPRPACGLGRGQGHGRGHVILNPWHPDACDICGRVDGHLDDCERARKALRATTIPQGGEQASLNAASHWYAVNQAGR